MLGLLMVQCGEVDKFGIKVNGEITLLHRFVEIEQH